MRGDPTQIQPIRQRDADTCGKSSALRVFGEEDDGDARPAPVEQTNDAGEEPANEALAQKALAAESRRRIPFFLVWNHCLVTQGVRKRSVGNPRQLFLLGLPILGVR